jgi:hypothetical protein
MKLVNQIQQSLLEKFPFDKQAYFAFINKKLFFFCNRNN